MQRPDDWPLSCPRKIRIVVFLFCAALGLVAAAFLLVYTVREWRGYGLFQRILVLGLVSINIITAVALVFLVTVLLQPHSTTICLGVLLLLQIGGTSVFTIFSPRFPCLGFGESHLNTAGPQNTCQQLPITATGWLWTLPGVLFLCTTWILLLVFVIRPSFAKYQKTPPPLVGEDEESKSTQMQNFQIQSLGSKTSGSPPWDPPILWNEQPTISVTAKEEKREDYPYADVAEDVLLEPSKSPGLIEEVVRPQNIQPASFSHVAKKVPPPLDIMDDAYSEEINGPDSDEKTLISSHVSTYSALPTSGTRYRIELKLPDQPQRPPTSDLEAFSSPFASSPDYGRSSRPSRSPATSPYPFPNPAAYTRPPFTSSPLTQSYIPLDFSGFPETTTWTPFRGSRLNARTGPPLRESVFPLSPISGRLTPRPPPRSIVAVQGRRPLVDRYGRVASTTSMTFDRHDS